nr:glutaredoxin domain-containing protein [Halobaculum saliterrae]
MDAEEAHERTTDAIADNEVVLFMKGNARMPQCGYSKRAVGLISRYRDDVATVDTLKNLDAFREALEAESGWETIPQTFVDGEFVGGSDVLAELEERGELAETLNAEGGAVASGSPDGADPEAPF